MSFTAGIPLLAVTGTADENTKKAIQKELCMSTSTVKLFVSPNRKNLKFTVSKVKKMELMNKLSWIIDELREKGPSCPQTLIFCCTLNDIATVINWMLMKLGSSAFYPQTSKKREHCLLGIYHSMTVEKNKDRLTKGLKENGNTRCVLATTALSMGVNFPHIRRVVMYGTPRSILDFHQEAGRAGRDGEVAEVFHYYHGQQSGHCDDDVKDFLKKDGCIRVAAYSSLDKHIAPLEPLHDCCMYCEKECACGEDNCKTQEGTGNKNSDVLHSAKFRTREVATQDKELLKEALTELKNDMVDPITVFGKCHGFSEELLEDVVENCDKIFSLEDIMKFVPVYSSEHALRIYEIISDIFEDCEIMADCTPHVGDVSGSPVSYGLGYLLGCEYIDDDNIEDLNLDIL